MEMEDHWHDEAALGPCGQHLKVREQFPVGRKRIADNSAIIGRLEMVMQGALTAGVALGKVTAPLGKEIGFKERPLRKAGLRERCFSDPR